MQTHTIAILAQGTSWAVAVTQAFLAAVQIPRVWVFGRRGLFLIILINLLFFLII